MTMYDHYLITGATGFLGKTLTERLIKSGARVTALVLADDPLRAELPAAVEPIFGDVTDKASLQAFFDTIQEPRRTCLMFTHLPKDRAVRSSQRRLVTPCGGRTDLTQKASPSRPVLSSMPPGADCLPASCCRPA